MNRANREAPCFPVLFEKYGLAVVNGKKHDAGQSACIVPGTLAD